MKPSSDTTFSQHSPRRSPVTPAARTFHQIAEILAERDGTAMTQTLVKEMCRVAETIISEALLTDPISREQLQPIAAHRHQAMRAEARDVRD